MNEYKILWNALKDSLYELDETLTNGQLYRLMNQMEGNIKFRLKFNAMMEEEGLNIRM